MSERSGRSEHLRRAWTAPFALAYRALARLMVCDVTRLLALKAADARRPVAERRGTFRLLTAVEVERLARDAANELDAEFADRIRSGRDLCYASLHGEMLAGYIWLALGLLEAEQNRGARANTGVAVEFGHQTAFVYKALVRPEVRGRHLYGLLLVGALEVLAPRGITRLATTADWSNRAALDSCRKVGFRTVGTIWRLGCGRVAMTLAPRQAAARLGILLGREARVAKRMPLAEDDIEIEGAIHAQCAALQAMAAGEK